MRPKTPESLDHIAKIYEGKIPARELYDMLHGRFDIQPVEQLTRDLNQFDKRVGLFGTAAKSLWRGAVYWRFHLDGQGLEERIYNPQVPDGQRKPEMMVEEAEEFQRDGIILLPVLNESRGEASSAEIGWLLTRAILSGKRVGILIGDGTGQSPYVKQTRGMITAFLSGFTAGPIQLPSNIFIADNVEELADRALDQTKELLTAPPESLISEVDLTKFNRTDGLDCVLVCGSSDARYPAGMMERDDLVVMLNRMHITYQDTLIPESRREAEYEQLIEDELQMKTRSKVIVNVINNHSLSLGSLNESGLLAAHAIARGQKYCLYIQEWSDETLQGTAEQRKGASRARGLVIKHAQKLLEDYPKSFFLANSIDEVKAFVATHAKIDETFYGENG